MWSPQTGARVWGGLQFHSPARALDQEIVGAKIRGRKCFWAVPRRPPTAGMEESSHPFGAPSGSTPHKATGNFCTLHKALEGMHRSLKVTAEWFELQESDRAVGRFSIKDMILEPLSEAPGAMTIWPCRQRAAPRFPPRPREDGDPHANDEDEPLPLEDGDAEDISDEDAEGEPFDPENDPAGNVDDMMGFILEDLEAALGLPPDDIPPPPPRGSAGEAAGSATANAAGVHPEPVVAPPIPVEPRPNRRGAIVTMHVPGGSISFYASKGAFEAVCENRLHGRCVLTRTNASKRARHDAGGVAIGGRPVAFLAAWLGAGQDLPTKEAHWSADAMERPLAERQELRRTIGGIASGRTLLACERPLLDGEPEEAPSLAPYLGSR